MVNRYRCSRRSALLLALAVSPVWAADAGPATPFDPEDPVANLRLEFAMGCASTNPRVPQYYVWSGAVDGRRLGASQTSICSTSRESIRAPARFMMIHAAAASDSAPPRAS
jgi:hypothetical protein